MYRLLNQPIYLKAIAAACSKNQVANQPARSCFNHFFCVCYFKALFSRFRCTPAVPAPRSIKQISTFSPLIKRRSLLPSKKTRKKKNFHLWWKKTVKISFRKIWWWSFQRQRPGNILGLLKRSSLSMTRPYFYTKGASPSGQERFLAFFCTTTNLILTPPPT